MKKIIFSTMIACLLAFVGCQNEELVNENTNNGGEKVILTANIQGAADSRVVLTPGKDDDDNPIVKVAWNESGETFEVYGSSGASSTFTQIAGTNQFEGTLPETANGKYEAVYGDFNSLDEQDGKLGQSTANDTPVWMGATFDSSSPSITFEHVTAILKPTFMVDDTDIDNSITKIVMSNVAKPTPGDSDNAFNLETITITPTSSATVLDDNIYIHLIVFPQLYVEDYEFTFSVTADGKNYTGSLTIPEDMSIEAGKLYTATIALTENTCKLPDGITFRNAVHGQMTDGTRAIKFIANSAETGTQIGTSSAYMKLNGDGTTLEIHTAANEFVFDADCYCMFSTFDDDSGNDTFNRFANLTEINFNNCINTANVMGMASMFDGCIALQSLNLSSFNSANVTDMNYMFYNCQALPSLNLSSFDTSKVTNMEGMFFGCSSLTSLDLSSFNTSNVTTMNSMFASSSLLSSITFGKSFNTSKVTSMLRMFENCSALTTINFSGFNTPNVINFDTSKVTDMSSMFSGCSSLTTLDLSSFTADNVGSMYFMFYGCGKLEELHLENFKPTTEKETHYYSMFSNVGSELTSGTTQIYVATPNPFEGKSTGINTEKAEFKEVNQNN